MFITQTDELCQPNSPGIGAETIFNNVQPIPCTLYSGINSESGWGQEWAFRERVKFNIYKCICIHYRLGI